MPKLVDRDHQRTELAWAACRAIASKGIERVTIRDVAAEAGRSTGMVTHYFADKESLLVAALTTATEACHERLLRRALADPVNLRAVLSESLPLNAQVRLEWAIWVNYWATATTSGTLGAEQRRHYRAWHHIIEGMLTTLRDTGRLREGIEPAAAADLLMTVVDGLGLRATVDPEGWPARRILLCLDRELALIEAGGSVREYSETDLGGVAGSTPRLRP
jgi:TetR/AcrR family transcriptional regulator, transcriptional repressor of bet genes